jgi:pentatricopeptide repeat protein
MKPDVIAYNSAIRACQNAGRVGEAMALVQKSGYLVSIDHSLEIDLHGLTVAVGVSTVECGLVSLVVGVALGWGLEMQNDLVIITGRGSHSVHGEARIQSATLGLLNHQLRPPLSASVDESNAGRVIVREADFKAWAMSVL